MSPAYFANQLRATADVFTQGMLVVTGKSGKQQPREVDMLLADEGMVVVGKFGGDVGKRVQGYTEVTFIPYGTIQRIDYELTKKMSSPLRGGSWTSVSEKQSHWVTLHYLKIDATPAQKFSCYTQRSRGVSGVLSHEGLV